MPDKNKATTLPKPEYDALFADESTSPSADIDLGNFKEEIGAHESDGDYSAENDTSSAKGKYQFLWESFGDRIRKETGVRNAKEFLANHAAQDKFMDSYTQSDIIPWVQQQKESGNTRGLTDKQLGQLYHFIGPGGAEKYLTTGKYKVPGQNVSIDNYLEEKVPRATLPADEYNSLFEDDNPQKKSPSVTGSDNSLQGGQANSSQIEGVTQFDPNTGVPVLNQPQAGTTQIQPGPQPQTQPPIVANVGDNEINKTANAANVIAQDVVNNAPQSYTPSLNTVPMTKEGNPAHDLTNPHADPQGTAQWGRHRIATLEAQRQSELAQAKQSQIEGAPIGEGKTADQINAEYDQKVNAIKDAVGHTVSLQQFNKEYTTKKYTPEEAQTITSDINSEAKDKIGDIDNQISATQKAIKDASSGIKLKIPQDEYSALLQKNKDLQVQKFNAQREYAQKQQQVQSETKYNPIQLGAEHAALSGDKQAQQDLADLNQGKPINPNRQQVYNVKGDEILKTGIANVADEGIKNEVSKYADNTGDRLFENNKGYYLNKMANARYADENPLSSILFPTSDWTKAEVKQYGQKIGLSDNAIKELQKDPTQIPKSASQAQLFTKGALDTYAPLWEGGARTIGALGGVPSEMVNTDFPAGWQNKRGPGSWVAGDMPSDQNSFHNLRGGIGQVVSGIGGLAGLTGEVGLAAKGAEAFGVGAETATKLANMGVMSFNGYNDAYHNSEEIIGNKPEDEPARHAYALVNGLLTGAIFSINPQTALLTKAFKATGKEGESLVAQIEKNKGLNFVTTDEGKNALLDYTKHFLKENGIQAGLATTQKIAEDITNTIANPNVKQNIPEDIKNTAISTSLAMLIPSLIGASGREKSQTPFNAAAVWEMGSNPDLYSNHIDGLLKTGKITPEQAQTSQQALATMKNIVANVPTKNDNGEALSPNQVKDYAFKMLQEHTLQQQVDQISEQATATNTKPDKVQIDNLNKKIADLQKQRQKSYDNPVTPTPRNQYIQSIKTENNTAESIEAARQEELRKETDRGYHEETLAAPDRYEWQKDMATQYLADPEGYLKEGIRNAQEYIKNDPNNEDANAISNSVIRRSNAELQKIKEINDKYDAQLQKLKKQSNQAPADERSVATDAQSAVQDYVTKIEKEGKDFKQEEDYKRHIDELKENPEEALKKELTFYQKSLEREKAKKNPKESEIKSIQNHIDEVKAVSDKVAQEKNIAENKKEDISLTSKEETPKTNDHEKSNGQNGDANRQENGSGQTNAEDQRSNTEVRGDQENGRVQGQEESLKEPTAKDSEAGASEQPTPAISVSGKKKRKAPAAYDDSIPVKEDPNLQTQDLGEVKGQDEEKTAKEVKEATIEHPDEPADIMVAEHPQGESFNEAKDRFKGAVDKIAKDAPDNTVVMTHSWGLKLLEAAEKKGWDHADLGAEHQKQSTETGDLIPYKTEDGRTIWFARHGETEDNLNGKQRTDDTRLTEKGRQQARDIATKLKEMGIKPSQIITSDLPRAKETSDIISKEFAKQKNEYNPPQPAKSLYEMTGDELDSYHKELKQYIKDFEQNILGDNYKEFISKQKIADNPMGLHSREVEKAAEDRVKEIFNSLSKEDQDALDGVINGDVDESKIYDPEDVKPIRSAVQIVEGAQDEKELGRDIGSYLIDLNDAPKEFSKMKWRQKIAFSAMNAARRIIQERGWDGKKVTEVALKHAASKFPDEEDAEFMLSKYLDFAKNKKDTPTQSQEPQKKIISPAKKAAPKKETEFQRRKREATQGEPQSFKEAVLRLIAGGERVNQEDIKHDLGISGKDLKPYLRRLSTKGTKVDDFIEQFHNPDEEHRGALNLVSDTQDARREFMDLWQQYAHDDNAALAELERMQGKDYEKWEEEKYQAHTAGEKISDAKESDINRFIKNGEFEPHQKATEQIHDAELTDHDDESITNYLSNHINYDGKVNGETALDPSNKDFKELYANLSPAGKELFDALLQEKETGGWIELTSKQKTDFEKLQKQAHEKQKATEGNTEPSKEPAVQSVTASRNEQQDDEAATEKEKLNQAPTDERSVATDAQPEDKTSETKLRLRQIEDNLRQQRASQQVEAKKREQAEKEKNIPEANKHNENWYKKQEKIDKLEEEKSGILKDQEREEREASIAKVFDNLAGKIQKKYEANKAKHAGESYATILGISPKIADHVTDYLVARIIEGIGDLKNLTIAIDRGLRQTKEKYGDEAKELSRKDHEAIEDYMFSKGQKRPIIEHEPDLPTDQKVYAEGIMEDIRSGELSYGDAEKEVKEEELLSREGEPMSAHAQENNKGKILNYIDWHDQQDQKDITSPQRAVRELKNLEYGVENLPRPGSKTWEDTLNNAKSKIDKNPFAAEKLVNDLAESKNGRPLTDDETALILIHRKMLENDYDDANEQINEIAAKRDDAIASGDRASEQNYNAEIHKIAIDQASISDKLQKVSDVVEKGGTELGRGLNAYKMLINKRYELHKMRTEYRAKVNDGKPLTDEQEKMIKDLHQRITDKQKAVDDLIQQQEEERSKLEKQILDLQDQVIAGKQEKSSTAKDQLKQQVLSTQDSAIKNRNLLNKKTAGARLRQWADEFEKKSKGNVYSSPIPITPKMIADAVRLVADGLDAGEEIFGKIKEVIGNIKKDNPGINEQTLKMHINKGIIESGILEPSQKKREAKDLSNNLAALFKIGPDGKPTGELNKAAVPILAAAQREKMEYAAILKQAEQENLSWWAKKQNFVLGVYRASLLSNPLILGKLLAASGARIGMDASEGGVKGGYSLIFSKIPALAPLAKGATGEGGGYNVKLAAKSLATGYSNWAKDAKAIMGTKNFGKSDLQLIFSKYGDLPPEALGIPGRTHSVMKSPIWSATFERQLEKRFSNTMATGGDVTNPIVLTAIATGAKLDADRAIFMQENTVANAFNRGVGTLEQHNKGFGTLAHVVIPFPKVGSNITAEASKYIYGLPYGAYKIVKGLFNEEGLKGMSPEEKDNIMRYVSKGTIGLGALVAWAYYHPQNFGGTYMPGQKKKDDIDYGGMKIGGISVPKTYMEAPIFQAMQAGADFRHMIDLYREGKKKGSESAKFINAAWQAGSGLIDGNPYAGETKRLGGVLSYEKDRDYFVDELAKNAVIPGLIGYVAKATDPADPGSILGKALDPENKRKAPKTLWEHFESNIPGLRENLDEKKPKNMDEVGRRMYGQ